MLWVLCAFIIFLLFLSALFSGSETALTTVSRARIHHLQKEGNFSARLVTSLQQRIDNLLGVILFANNFVNILATSIATSIFIKFFSEGGIGIATFLMTILLIVFAEVMPKVYALQNAEKFSLRVAPFLSVFFKILSPVAEKIHRFVHWIWYQFGIDFKKSTEPFSARKEIMALLEMLHDVQARNEQGMLRGILDLSNLKNRDVLKPSKDVIMINGDRRLSEIIPELLKTPYSRFPVWVNSPDSVIGVVHLRFLTNAFLLDRHGNKKVKDFIVTPPWFVSSETSLLQQLQQFKIRHHHMALVVDKEGHYNGIVTLEDVLEEIVGDISDEADAFGQLIYPDHKGGYIIDGTASPRQINQLLGWSLPEDETKNILGLILQENPNFLKSKIPLAFSGYEFKLLTGLHNDVKWIHISPGSDARNT
jgi:Mg2+/Co2+ transporter CorB